MSQANEASQDAYSVMFRAICGLYKELKSCDCLGDEEDVEATLRGVTASIAETVIASMSGIEQGLGLQEVQEMGMTAFKDAVTEINLSYTVQELERLFLL